MNIRYLADSDLGFADSLRAAAGWNQTIADWQRALRLSPDGCFIAESDGQPAGTAIVCPYGPTLAWIGMLLVHPERRRRGVGSALLRRCLEYAQRAGISCVKLDATPVGKSLYDQFGFQTETELTRWEMASAQTITASDESGVAPLREADWPKIFRLDEQAFGLSRPRVLLAYARDSRCVCCAVKEGFGFGMLREGSRAFYLGPIVTETPEIAERIARHLLRQTANRPVFWDLFDANQPATALAQLLGFTPQRRLIRMFYGELGVVGDGSLQFGIADPAVG